LLVLSFFPGKFFEYPVGSGKGFFLISSIPAWTSTRRPLPALTGDFNSWLASVVKSDFHVEKYHSFSTI
jgi:hypothetical protein